MSGTDTAVLLPCRNEAGAIGNVVSEIHAAAPGFRIYVCDNASTDGTKEAARRAGAIVIAEQKRGKGHAVETLLSAVSAKCYIMCDGDGTYDTDDIQDFAGMVLDQNYDFVTGNRLNSGYYESSVQLTHKLGNRFFNRLLRILFRPGIDDVLSGYRAMSAKFVRSLPPLNGGFTLESELSAHALLGDFKIANIPVRVSDRGYGKSKVKLTDGVKIFLTLLRIRIFGERKKEQPKPLINGKEKR